MSKNRRTEAFELHEKLMRNEARQVEPRDIASLCKIEIKSQEFPMGKEELTDLMDLDAVHGLMLLNRYMPAGFAFYTVAERGSLLDICRLSIMPHALEDAGLTKLVEMLTIQIGNTQPPRLRILIPETEIESPLFEALLNHGFNGVGVAPDRFLQYGTHYAGIKLERP